MAMFSNGGSAPPERTRSAGEHGLSILAKGMRFVGELVTDGVVKIEGTVEGTVRAEGQVLVAKDGVVKGDIYTKEAVIGGEVNGAIYADYRLEAQSTSVITGDVNTPRVLVHDGGKLNGRIDMSGKHKKAEAKPATDQKTNAQPQAQKTEKKATPFEVIRELETANR